MSYESCVDSRGLSAPQLCLTHQMETVPELPHTSQEVSDHGALQVRAALGHGGYTKVTDPRHPGGALQRKASLM